MPNCPDCDHAYTPGQAICEECGADLSPIEVVKKPTASMEKAPQYYCDPNQLVDDIKGCGYIGAMDGNICPNCGGLWENPVPASQANQTTIIAPSEPHIEEEPPLRLVIEGNQTVLYEGHAVSEIPFDVDELSIGCRDTEQGHYPDIDLLKYRVHDPFLSRKHALFFKEEGKYFIKVLSQAASTGFNSKSDILEAGECREIETGNRLFFSDSIVITLKN